MVVSFLKKIFGAGEEAAVPAAPQAAVPPKATETDEPDVEGFVTFVVRALVDHPETVEVKTIPGDRGDTIQVACVKSDIGKIIGKSGRTIAAIRALANGAAGRLGRKVQVDILD